VSGCCGHGNELSGFISFREFLGQLDMCQLQGEFCSMEFIRSVNGRLLGCLTLLVDWRGYLA
jgi:hypothetical protein